MTLEAKYNHLAVENDKYQNWIEKGYFTAGDLSKRPYCIVIPPPNVTGKLHLGHAWDTTLQDILCRYKRLKGYGPCGYCDTGKGRCPFKIRRNFSL